MVSGTLFRFFPFFDSDSCSFCEFCVGNLTLQKNDKAIMAQLETAPLPPTTPEI
jgi:hypothetical protein